MASSVRSRRILSYTYMYLLILVQCAMTLTSDNSTISRQSDVTENIVKAVEASATPYSNTRQGTEGRGQLLAGGEKNIENKKAESPKIRSPGFLLYEVQRDMATLTLDDINYVLDLGEDLFTYSLGDKLGYLEDDKDPHIDVIESDKANLMKKLKSHRDKLISAIKGAYVTKKPQDNPVTTPTPPHALTPGDDFMKSKIAYEVVKDINELTVEAIDSLLHFGPDFGRLPYALSMELGYGMDESDLHVLYLTGKNDSVLKELLEKVKKDKLERSLKADRNHAEMTSDSSPLLHVQHPVSPEEVTTKPHTKQGEEESLISVKPTVKPSNVGTHISTLDHHDDEDEGKESTPSNKDNVMLTSENNGEIKTETIGADFLDEINLDEDIKSSLLEMLDNAPFLEYLNDADGDLYNALFDGEIDKTIAADLLREYSDWRETTKDEDPDIDESYNKENKGELDNDQEYLDEDDKSRSYGAWHFLTMFIILGVLVVLGYLCLHNRKKIREGIESYVGDVNKRRRRAREYKPVMQAADNIQ